jgi:hypothetical protein
MKLLCKYCTCSIAQIYRIFNIFVCEKSGHHDEIFQLIACVINLCKPIIFYKSIMIRITDTITSFFFFFLYHVGYLAHVDFYKTKCPT